MRKKLQTRTRNMALFGLLFLSIILCAGLFGALAQLRTPMALIVPAAVAAVLVFSGSGLRIIANQRGATGVVEDSILNTRTIVYTHSAALSPGDPLLINGSLCIAVNTTAANVQNTFVIAGKVNLPKTAALAINALDAVCWDNAASEVNKTAGGNTACGYCHTAAAAADTTVTIMLVPNAAIIALAQTTQTSITDPGDAGAIPVTASGYVDIVTAGAETRTLAAPTFKGQTLQINFKTDGGDCVIACDTTVNQTGNNRVTLNDAGDCVLLTAKTNGANIRWSVVSNDGAALSTV